MPIVPYLAMTAEEIAGCPALPEKTAWMACHFSVYGTGLQDLPKRLPEGALLIMDDRIPVNRHDPQCIVNTLKEITFSGLLLDFQRPGNPETAAIVRTVLEVFPQAAVSECYAKVHSCAVLLSPTPMLTPFETHIAPWEGRQIWLEAAPELLEILLTEDGAVQKVCKDDGPLPFYDEILCCHYRTEVFDDHARFILRRDVDALLQKAEALGITHAVGLYQQLK